MPSSDLVRRDISTRILRNCVMTALGCHHMRQHPSTASFVGVFHAAGPHKPLSLHNRCIFALQHPTSASHMHCDVRNYNLRSCSSWQDKRHLRDFRKDNYVGTSLIRSWS